MSHTHTCTHINCARRVRSCIVSAFWKCSQLSTPLPMSVRHLSALIIITSRQVQSFAHCQYTSCTSTCSCVFESAHHSYSIDRTDPISNHHLHVCPEQDGKLLDSYDFVLRVPACRVPCVRDLHISCAHICIFMCVCLLINRISATLDLRSIENTLVKTLQR